MDRLASRYAVLVQPARFLKTLLHIRAFQGYDTGASICLRAASEPNWISEDPLDELLPFRISPSATNLQLGSRVDMKYTVQTARSLHWKASQGAWQYAMTLNT